MRFAIVGLFCAALVTACGSPGNAGRHVATSKRSAAERVLIDVRTPAEYERGHIQGAINIPVNELEKRIGQTVPDKNAHLQVHCQSGRRSAAAKATLERLGFTDIEDLGSFAHAREVVEGK